MVNWKLEECSLVAVGGQPHMGETNAIRLATENRINMQWLWVQFHRAAEAQK